LPTSAGRPAKLIAPSEVWVDDISYGDNYFSHQINADGYYYQFGQSWRFFQNGQTKFLTTGTLDERIKDIDFLLKVIKGGQIRIDHHDFPYLPQILSEQDEALQNIIRCFTALQEIKCVFDFLGMTATIDVTAFSKRDFHLLEVLSEHVVHGKECPAIFKNEGFKVLWIGKYPFLVLAYQGKIINVFSRNYYEAAPTALNMNDGTQVEMSP
jgi:hypothetical protein